MGPWISRYYSEISAASEALHEMGPWISRYYSEISAASEALKAEYQSLVDSDRKESAQEVLEAALMERLRDEVEQGFTLSGPHRDNLVFRLGGRTAQRFASMGQLKSVLLAWKLAEARFLESKTGASPVLLMDDIFSELDRRRACSLMALLSSFGQVLLTTARDSDLDFEAQGYQIVAL
jgi:DNA replication and repair protein RecF